MGLFPSPLFGYLLADLIQDILLALQQPKKEKDILTKRKHALFTPVRAHTPSY